MSNLTDKIFHVLDAKLPPDEKIKQIKVLIEADERIAALGKVGDHYRLDVNTVGKSAYLSDGKTQVHLAPASYAIVQSKVSENKILGELKNSIKEAIAEEFKKEIAEQKKKLAEEDKITAAMEAKEKKAAEDKIEQALIAEKTKLADERILKEVAEKQAKLAEERVSLVQYILDVESSKNGLSEALHCAAHQKCEDIVYHILFHYHDYVNLDYKSQWSSVDVKAILDQHFPSLLTAYTHLNKARELFKNLPAESKTASADINALLSKAYGQHPQFVCNYLLECLHTILSASLTDRPSIEKKFPYLPVFTRMICDVQQAVDEASYKDPSDNATTESPLDDLFQAWQAYEAHEEGFFPDDESLKTFVRSTFRKETIAGTMGLAFEQLQASRSKSIHVSKEVAMKEGNLPEHPKVKKTEESSPEKKVDLAAPEKSSDQLDAMSLTTERKAVQPLETKEVKASPLEEKVVLPPLEKSADDLNLMMLSVVEDGGLSIRDKLIQIDKILSLNQFYQENDPLKGMRLNPDFRVQRAIFYPGGAVQAVDVLGAFFNKYVHHGLSTALPVIKLLVKNGYSINRMFQLLLSMKRNDKTYQAFMIDLLYLNPSLSFSNNGGGPSSLDLAKNHPVGDLVMAYHHLSNVFKKPKKEDKGASNATTVSLTPAMLEDFALAVEQNYFFAINYLAIKINETPSVRKKSLAKLASLTKYLIDLIADANGAEAAVKQLADILLPVWRHHSAYLDILADFIFKFASKSSFIAIAETYIKGLKKDTLGRLKENVMKRIEFSLNPDADEYKAIIHLFEKVPSLGLKTSESKRSTGAAGALSKLSVLAPPAASQQAVATSAERSLVDHTHSATV